MKTVGAMLGQMSGSIGGVTASHNRGGQYFRRRAVPTNPNSARQAAVRGYMSTAVSVWGSITEAQRASWETYAANTPTTDSMGQTLVLTGQQMYVRAYVSMCMHGAPAPNAGPTIFDTGVPPNGLKSTGSNNPLTLAFDGSDLASTASFTGPAEGAGVCHLFLGRPQNAGVNFFKGPYQFATSVAFADAATSAVFVESLVDLQGGDPLVAGQRVPVRLVNQYNDGRKSTSFEAICVVADDST